VAVQKTCTDIYWRPKPYAVRPVAPLAAARHLKTLDHRTRTAAGSWHGHGEAAGQERLSASSRASPDLGDGSPGRCGVAPTARSKRSTGRRRSTRWPRGYESAGLTDRSLPGHPVAQARPRPARSPIEVLSKVLRSAGARRNERRSTTRLKPCTRRRVLWGIRAFPRWRWAAAQALVGTHRQRSSPFGRARGNRLRHRHGTPPGSLREGDHD
jgi:hypothetical protein